jgi:hypothetical protein
MDNLNTSITEASESIIESSDSLNDTSSGNESSDIETEDVIKLTIHRSRWYDASNDPRYSDLSEHSSDDQPYVEPESDEEKPK